MISSEYSNSVKNLPKSNVQKQDATRRCELLLVNQINYFLLLLVQNTGYKISEKSHLPIHTRGIMLPKLLLLIELILSLAHVCIVLVKAPVYILNSLFQNILVISKNDTCTRYLASDILLILIKLLAHRIDSRIKYS